MGNDDQDVRPQCDHALHDDIGNRALKSWRHLWKLFSTATSGEICYNPRSYRAPTMTPAERRITNDLSKRITEEKNYFLFQQLVERLDELLARNQQRLTNQSAPKPPPPTSNALLKIHYRN